MAHSMFTLTQKAGRARVNIVTKKAWPTTTTNLSENKTSKQFVDYRVLKNCLASQIECPVNVGIRLDFCIIMPSITNRSKQIIMGHPVTGKS